MGIRLFVNSLLGLFLLCIAPQSIATTITPTGGQQTKYLPNHVAGQDFLYINPPNSAGISINKFSTFDLDRPLKLSNTPGYDQISGAAIPSASTVVIVVNKYMYLRSQIDIVGPATDLVFIATDEDEGGAGYLTCENCVFNNALRLSLITGEFGSIRVTDTLLGAMRPRGRLTVDSLYAPGVVGLDLVSSIVNTSGTIDINQAAIKNSSAVGGYSAVAHGNYRIGSGGIDIVGGSLWWHYEKRQLSRASTNSFTYRFGGDFKAPRVNLSVSGNVKFEGKIDTRVNALSAVSYHNKTHIPQEGVTIQALSSGTSPGVDVKVIGDIYSDNTVDIRATKNIGLGSSSHIKANSIQVVAGKEVYNNAYLQAIRVGQPVQQSVIGIAGDEVINQSRIHSRDVIDIWAERGVANQYGGVVQANGVSITAQKGIVRNGSRTPYIDDSERKWELLSINTPVFESIRKWPERSTSSYYDSSREGAFFWVPGGVNVSGSSSLKMPSNHRAHILGRTIKLQAQGVENINPYYEYLDVMEQQFAANERLTIDESDRVNDVVISAEDYLEISGAVESSTESAMPAKYFVNASALLLANSPNSNAEKRGIYATADEFINTRYRTELALVYGNLFDSGIDTPFESDPRESPNATVLASDFYSASIAVFSPPGFLASMSNVNISSSAFTANLFGYFEAYGTASIKAPTFKNIGMARESYYNGAVRAKLTETSANTILFEFNGINRKAELDSLFYVQNSLYIEASAWYETISPFTYFVRQAVAQLDGNSFLPGERRRSAEGCWKVKSDLGSTGRTPFVYTDAEVAASGFPGGCDSSLSLSASGKAPVKLAWNGTIVSGNAESPILNLGSLNNISADGKIKINVKFEQQETIKFTSKTNDRVRRYYHSGEGQVPYGRDSVGIYDLRRPWYIPFTEEYNPPPSERIYLHKYQEVQTKKTSVDAEVSILDVLGDYYEKVKSRVSQIANEFDWWGLAG